MFNYTANLRIAGLGERTTIIKTGGLKNMRYAGDSTLLAESEKHLEELIMKVKMESEKSELMLNI